MVIRLVSVSDQVDPPQFHEIFSALLGWNGDLGYLISVHGQEFNCFRRNTRSKGLSEFKQRRQESSFICDTLHMWEWDVRVLDIQDGAEADQPSRLTMANPSKYRLCARPSKRAMCLKADSMASCTASSASSGLRSHRMATRWNPGRLRERTSPNSRRRSGLTSLLWSCPPATATGGRKPILKCAGRRLHVSRFAHFYQPRTLL
jgi:hypothetical protein